MYRFLFFLFFIFASAVSAQELKWSGIGLEHNMTVGKIIRHTPRFIGPLPEVSYAWELNIVKQTYGRKDWEQRRRYPLIGLGFTHINYNNPSVYGHFIGVYPNLQLPLLRRGGLEWTFRAGMGIGYMTRPYERLPHPNEDNAVIGGHWNNISPFSSDIRWRVNQHWDLQAGLSFFHVSNAAFQQPNLGINMWGGHLGFRYFPVSSRPERIHKELNPLKNRWLLQGRASIAFIEHRPADGPLYPTYIGALYASKRYLGKNKAFGGIDFYYHTSQYAFVKSIEAFEGREGSQSYQVALLAGNEFLIGRVGVVFQVGYYLKEAYMQQNRFYQKLGGNIYFIRKEQGWLKELYGSALLKTHLADAELFEMGMGISF